MRVTQFPKPLSTAASWLCATLLTVGFSPLGHAGLTDISQTPLITAGGTPVKPNLLFILDDSGSMASNYLPEEADMGNQTYSLNTPQCNGLAFDPALPYPPPVNADGTSKSNQPISSSFDADSWLEVRDINNYDSRRPLQGANLVNASVGATITVKINISTRSSSWYWLDQLVTIYDNSNKQRWMIGMVNANYSASTNNLSIKIVATSGSHTLSTPYVGTGHPHFVYYTYPNTSTRLGYTYLSTGKVDTSTNFYKECNSVVGKTPGSTVFTRQVMTPTDPKAQAFANWYRYYSNRMDMMKTVVSQAFKQIDDRFRVGYTTILSKTVEEQMATSVSSISAYTKWGPESTSKMFVNVRDFDATQRSQFYAYLDATDPSGYTPLRGALSTAGRYFARRAPGQSTDPKQDPMQYSCQKNFAILATDGGWNTYAEVSSGTNRYGPYKLDNTTVDNQDGSAARPMRDGTGTTAGASSNSLADVAYYYYNTDLRPTGSAYCTGSKDVDVCDNTVVPLQRMSTYTMSLGQSGTLKFDPNYLKQTSGDYLNIVQGTKQWPTPVASSTNTSPAHVDDLWHAAVNGGGLFFNVADPNAVTQGLKTALTEISKENARGSTAAASTLRPVAGDNQVFVAGFTSGVWIGDLQAYRLDVETGAPMLQDANGKDLAEWSAAAVLKTNTNRKIYYANSSKVLREFTYSNLDSDGFKSEFDGQCSKLSQCVLLSDSDKAIANDGKKLVPYLRGIETAPFRTRDSMLGDIVGSGPMYVSAPRANLNEASYQDFQTNYKDRRAVVYVGANDGMLHAFDALTGAELWAFIPSAVRANMVKLADANYSDKHQFFVDSSPIAADVYSPATGWRTILVAGMGAGGKSYVALDITNPAATPTLLWEFTDANLGLTYARPTIVKRKSGEWVVVFPSGYNNVGDGKGRMYTLNAFTGLRSAPDVVTSAGDTSTPSGLGPVRAWQDKLGDATADRFYAGDNLGNVWRMDIDGVREPKNAALLLATVENGDGKPQPITTVPQLTKIDQKGFITAAVVVGTGRMLGTSDMSDKTVQSIYGIRDNLSAEGLGKVRSSLVQQTLSTVNLGSNRTISKNVVDWSNKNGWFLDLPDAGERINVNMQMVGSTLVAGSNVPLSLASCTSGDGYGWLYTLDVANGSSVSQYAATKVTGSMIAGFTVTSKGALTTLTKKPLVNIKVDPKKVFLEKANKTSWREVTGR